MALLDSLVGYNLRRAAVRQRDRFRNTFAPYAIRPVQLTALTIIFHNQPIGQSTLGKVLGMKRANVVKVLDELEARDLIRRERSARDRRAYDVHLTGDGLAFTQQLLAVHEKLEADLARCYGQDELRQLVELLKRFRHVDTEPQIF
jgi:DNA-binding MarR family transcriptional regulator